MKTPYALPLPLGWCLNVFRVDGSANMDYKIPIPYQADFSFLHTLKKTENLCFFNVSRDVDREHWPEIGLVFPAILWTVFLYDIDGVIAFLENASNILFKWFSDNLFKGNANKCNLLFNVKDEVSIRKGDFNIVNSKCEKLLGAKFDYKLAFNRHVWDLCENVSRKINPPARVAPYISISKRRILMNVFFQITV